VNFGKIFGALRDSIQTNGWLGEWELSPPARPPQGSKGVIPGKPLEISVQNPTFRWGLKEVKNF